MNGWRTRSLLQGLVAGVAGVGGGVIISPVFLELGMHPQVAAATTAATVVSTYTSRRAARALLHPVALAS